LSCLLLIKSSFTFVLLAFETHPLGNEMDKPYTGFNYRANGRIKHCWKQPSSKRAWSMRRFKANQPLLVIDLWLWITSWKSLVPALPKKGTKTFQAPTFEETDPHAKVSLFLDMKLLLSKKDNFILDMELFLFIIWCLWFYWMNCCLWGHSLAAVLGVGWFSRRLQQRKIAP
jgi:hypothetical protein